MFNRKVMFSSTTDHWSTPKDVYRTLDAEFGFDFDPCPLHSSFDGLTVEWGGVNFVNPPYSDIKNWCKKAIEEWKKYPPDWKAIAQRIKEAADWQCQFCGKQCRRPGEPFDTHKNTLTVAHLNHDPMDCRPENLRAMCAPCHLRYDASHHAETRKNKVPRSEHYDSK